MKSGAEAKQLEVTGLIQLVCLCNSHPECLTPVKSSSWNWRRLINLQRASTCLAVKDRYESFASTEEKNKLWYNNKAPAVCRLAKGASAKCKFNNLHHIMERYSAITAVFKVSGDPWKQLPTTRPSGADVLIGAFAESYSTRIKKTASSSHYPHRAQEWIKCNEHHLVRAY